MLYCEACESYIGGIVNYKSPNRIRCVKKALRSLHKLYGKEVDLQFIGCMDAVEVRTRMERDLGFTSNTAAVYMNEIAVMITWAGKSGYIDASKWNRSAYSCMGTNSPFFNKCNIKEEKMNEQSAIAFDENSCALCSSDSMLSTYEQSVDNADIEVVSEKENPFSVTLRALCDENPSIKSDLECRFKCECMPSAMVAKWIRGSSIPNISNLAFVIRIVSGSIGGSDVAGRLLSSYIDCFVANKSTLSLASTNGCGLRSIVDFYNFRSNPCFRYLRNSIVDLEGGYPALSRWYGYVARWLKSLRSCGVSNEDMAKALGVSSEEVPKIIDTGIVYHAYRDLSRAYHVSADTTSTEWNDFVLKSIATLYSNMIYSEFIANNGNASTRVSFEIATGISSDIKVGSFGKISTKNIDDIERKLQSCVVGISDRYIEEYVPLLKAIYKHKVDGTHASDEEINAFLDCTCKYGVISKVGSEPTDMFVFVRKENKEETTMSNIEPIRSTEQFQESIKLLVDNWHKMQALRDLSLGSDSVTCEMISGTRKQIHGRIRDIAGSIASSDLDSIDRFDSF